MNYIVRPMNKQTLMCFNFAGTKKLDSHFVWIFSFEITLLNIARGTTDPEIDSVTWIKFSNNMTLLALVENFANRWHNLHWFKI